MMTVSQTLFLGGGEKSLRPSLGPSFGFVLVHTSEREDMLGRADIGWTFVVFDKR